MRKKIWLIGLLLLTGIVAFFCMEAKQAAQTERDRKAAEELEHQMLDEQLAVWKERFQEEQPLFAQAVEELLAAGERRDETLYSPQVWKLVNKYAGHVGYGKEYVQFTLFTNSLSYEAGSSCIYLTFYESDTPPQYAGMADGEKIAENWFLSKMIWHMDGI